MEFQKPRPQVITYRNYNNFDNDKFQADLKTCRYSESDVNSFQETFFSVFNKYAPIKKKYIEAFFMTGGTFYDKKTCTKKS